MGSDLLKREPFWLVWNPAGGPPRARHSSKVSAQDEARRLARVVPGADFFVLECIDGYRLAPPPKPPVDRLDIDPEWIPF